MTPPQTHWVHRLLGVVLLIIAAFWQFPLSAGTIDAGPGVSLGATGGSDQEIDLPPIPDQTLGDTPFVVTASASSGLTVELSSLTPGICSLVADSLYLNSTGTCVIAADQPGDADYLPAPQVQRAFLVRSPIAAGGYHSLRIGADGQLSAWGKNTDGQLGDGTEVERHSPVAVDLPDGIRIRAVAAGKFHSLAIDDIGVLYAWGFNSSGQLGDGTTTSRSSPVVVDLPVGVTATAVSAGKLHGLAIGSDGVLYAWGSNSAGQLGQAACCTDSSTPLPVSLPGGVTAIAVAAGVDHNLAAGSDGNPHAWGSNNSGKLGDGTTTWRDAPVAVLLPAGVEARALAAGYTTSLALGSDGQLYSWGFVGGDAPHAWTSLASGVSARDVSAYTHFLASASDGQLYGWGTNGSGQLGRGTISTSWTPAPASMPEGIDTVALAAGIDFSLALGSNGTLYTWGSNSDGQLSDGPVSDRATPAPIRAWQGIDFPALSAKTLGDAPFEIGATASSGLPVSFESRTELVCTVAEDTVTLIGAGTCTIRASQPGDDVYIPAADVDRSLAVAKMSQVIAFDPLPDRTFGDPDFAVTATASSGLAVQFASLTTDVCTIDGDTLTPGLPGDLPSARVPTGRRALPRRPDVVRELSISAIAHNLTVRKAGEGTGLSGNVFAANGSGTDSDANNDTLTVLQVDGTNDVGLPHSLPSGAQVTLWANGQLPELVRPAPRWARRGHPPDARRFRDRPGGAQPPRGRQGRTTPEDVLRELVQCLDDAGEFVIGWEQVRRWPEGAVEVFVEAGWTTAAMPASMVECPGCEDRCFEPVHVFQSQSGKRTRAYVACIYRDDLGRVPIPVTDLGQ